MPVTPDQLRTTFTEFASVDVYPDPTVAVWLGVAEKMVNSDRWGDLWEHGVMLYTAHHLVLVQRAAASQASGVAGGGRIGVQTSKSVDGVSVSYDTSSVTIDGAGHFNSTMYGIQFKQMANLMGAGPMHIGADMNRQFAGAAWPGVILPHF
jgi:hypothetical protein